jgi:hypothetical protein
MQRGELVHSGRTLYSTDIGIKVGIKECMSGRAATYNLPRRRRVLTFSLYIAGPQKCKCVAFELSLLSN